MPTDAEIKAAAKVLSPGWDWISPESQLGYLSDAEAALTAAEKVRTGKPDSASGEVPDEAVEAAMRPVLSTFSRLIAREVEHRLETFAPAIRADERERVKARVEAERLEETEDLSAGLSATGRAADRAYNRAIDDALAAIDEGDSDE